MVTRIIPALTAALLIALPADGADRERLARAALALADGVRPSVAPAPRAIDPKMSYPDGYKRATKESIPLVVFVGTDGPKPTGAVSAKAASLTDVDPPAVVVAYPVGDRMFIDTKLPADAKPEDVQRAVDAARGKKEAPAELQAPKPLDWEIRAEVKTDCICGDKCDCREKGRQCPSQCPLRAGPRPQSPAGYGSPPAGFEWRPDPRGPGGWGLYQTDATRIPVADPTVRAMTPVPSVVGGCANGRCNNPR